MKHLHNEESVEKAIKTRKSNLPQMSDPLDRETQISLDYHNKVLKVYTDHITVINRLSRLGYEHIKEQTVGGEVYSRTYEFSFDEMSKFVTSTIFK